MPESYEENKKKNEVDQESVTKNEVHEKVKLIEDNLVLGIFMRPYIDALCEHIRNVYLPSRYLLGDQKYVDRYWLGGQKYVDSLGVWATALSPSTETSFNDSFHILSEAVPFQRYSDIVGKLALEMWMNAGHSSSQTLDFWVWAENYTLKTAAQAIANAKTASEAIDSLRRMFADARRMFAVTRRMSAGTRDYIWETLGEPRGHSKSA